MPNSKYAALALAVLLSAAALAPPAHAQVTRGGRGAPAGDANAPDGDTPQPPPPASDGDRPPPPPPRDGDRPPPPRDGDRPPPPPPRNGKPKKPLTFESVDTNNDGKITPDEFAAAAKYRKRLANHPKLFERIDANHDGVIDKDEFDGWLAKLPGRPPRPPGGSPEGGSSGS